MDLLGCNEIRVSEKKTHLPGNLEKQLGVSLHFTTDDKGRCVVYPEMLSGDELVRENLQLKRELYIIKSKSNVHSLVLVTKQTSQMRLYEEKVHPTKLMIIVKPHFNGPQLQKQLPEIDKIKK